MSTSAADYLVDRRRLRRQLGVWRIVAFIAAALAIIALGARFSGALGFVGGPHIARLTVSGFIAGNEETLKLIREARNSPAVAAALVRIDSPGGGTEGSEEIYDELRRLAAKKPVAAVVGGMAASGAYIAALGADRIFARGNSIVGSIGVLVEYPNVSGLMDKVGVKLESIKSSPLKAAPNGFEPTSEEARAAMAALVAEFLRLVQGAGQRPARPQRRGAGQGRRRKGVHRPPGPARSSSSTRSATNAMRSPGWRRIAAWRRTCRCATTSRVRAGPA